MLPNKIHLLGYARTTNPNFNEVRTLAEYPQVRSLDTDAPFAYAYRGAMLRPGTVVERSKDYFKADPMRFSSNLTRSNLATLDGWANGRS
jgi:hypothetical protein